MITWPHTTTRNLAAFLALAASLTGCAAGTTPATPPPAPLAPSLQLISQDERQAYIEGFIAGRHYQARQGQAPTAAAPAAQPAGTATAPPAGATAAPPSATCPPDPPPPGGALPPGITGDIPGYSANGTAQPVKGNNVPF